VTAFHNNHTAHLAEFDIPLILRSLVPPCSLWCIGQTWLHLTTRIWPRTGISCAYVLRGCVFVFLQQHCHTMEK
jgi:hypothetical protein